jgi:hypothetical protein
VEPPSKTQAAAQATVCLPHLRNDALRLRAILTNTWRKLPPVMGGWEGRIRTVDPLLRSHQSAPNKRLTRCPTSGPKCPTLPMPLFFTELWRHPRYAMELRCSFRVRRAALDHIPGAARNYSEGGGWATRFTSTRKGTGTTACRERDDGSRGTAERASQGPRAMARARLPEVQFSGEYLFSQRKCV